MSKQVRIILSDENYLNVKNYSSARLSKNINSILLNFFAGKNNNKIEESSNKHVVIIIK